MEKIRVHFLNGDSFERLPPCDPPNEDIFKLLEEEYGANFYKFEWVDYYDDEDF